VDASQNGNVIFMATIQFDDRSHGPPAALATRQQNRAMSEPRAIDTVLDDDPSRPYLIHEIVTPSSKIVWLRPRDKVYKGGAYVHLAVLAFLSDSFFITTVAQVLGLRIQHRTSRRGESSDDPNAPVLKMMVSLDQVIYFHDWDFRADDWIYAEMRIQWADDGRALVRERLYDRRHRLVATCVQEVSDV
jgi:acyl-CoA thioesterase II